MQIKALITKNRNIVIVISFMIINTLSISLIFSHEYFYTFDRVVLNVFFVLIAIGVCFVPFFIILKYIKSITISKLFLIFIITRILLLCFFTILIYGVETDLNSWWTNIAKNILNGDLNNPYNPLSPEGLIADRWRLQPPLAMWWYTFNYLIYELNPFFWRFINFMLEVGIVYLMYMIVKELKIDINNFKIGFSLYIFSIFPIVGLTLYANYLALPILLAFLGILFYLKSKTNENYFYLSIACFTLNALSSYYGAVLLLGLFLLLLFRKQFYLLIVSITEMLAIFCIVCFPLLMHDAIGFIQRLTWILGLSSVDEIYTTIWLIDIDFLTYVPALFAIILVAIYVYVNRNRDISIEFFIVILSMFLVFTPVLAPYHLFWLISLLFINILYSFRKFLKAYLLFLLYFYLMYLFTAIAILLDPPETTGWASLLHFMSEIGFTLAIQLGVHIFFQIGLIYVIYSYTKQKFWIYALVAPFIVYYVFFLLFGV